MEGFGNENRRDSLLEGAGGEGEVCPDEEGGGGARSATDHHIAFSMRVVIETFSKNYS